MHTLFKIAVILYAGLPALLEIDVISIVIYCVVAVLGFIFMALNLSYHGSSLFETITTRLRFGNAVSIRALKVGVGIAWAVGFAILVTRVLILSPGTS